MKKQKRNRLWIAIGIVFLGMCFMPQSVFASAEEKNQELLEELIEELELSDLDSYLTEVGVKMSFSDLIESMISTGWGVESIAELTEWLGDFFFSELKANKKLFLEIILITFCFSLLKNTAGSFGNAYVSDTCFLLVYCVLAWMLLKSMYVFQGIVAETLQKCVSFMRIFVPCFCTGMFFSSNISASAGFYQIAFLLIYLVEWAFVSVLLPCIHIYVLLQIFNHFFEEGQFGNLADLVKTMVGWTLKLSGTLIFGLSAVQNLINPVKDRISYGTFGKVVSAIPGVGGVVNSAGEIVLGAGMMIKNGIGLAGMAVLLLIGIGPLLKTGCLSFFYKIMAAVTEPLADKRICGCIKELSEGALLYLKLLGYCLVLFFILIALTVSATSFVY